MRNYVLITTALFMLCAGASLIGLHPLGAMVFPVPIVVYVARRYVERGIGLVACAVLAGFVSTGSAKVSLYYGLVAATGFPLGIGMARQWTYGWTIVAVAGFAYLVVVGNILNAWTDWQEQARQTYDLLANQLQYESSQSDSDNAVSMVRNIVWLKDNWTAVGIGLLLWPLLIEASVGLSLFSLWLRRRYGIEGVRGSFCTMRTSEWLVWAVILVAVLCFADYRWPGTVLRTISWNAALALAAIYWLNGLAIAFYVLDAARQHMVLYMAGILALVWFGMSPMLCFIGLFDTWSDFRKKIDLFVEARKQRNNEE